MKLETNDPETQAVATSVEGPTDVSVYADGLIRIRILDPKTRKIVGGIALSRWDAKNLVADLPRLIPLAVEAERKIEEGYRERLRATAEKGEASP